MEGGGEGGVPSPNGGGGGEIIVRGPEDADRTTPSRPTPTPPHRIPRPWVSLCSRRPLAAAAAAARTPTAAGAARTPTAAAAAVVAGPIMTSSVVLLPRAAISAGDPLRPRAPASEKTVS